MNFAQRPFGNTSYRQAKRQRVFPLDRIPAHRPREVAREWLFDQPQKHLHDLSGQYPVHAFEYAKLVHDRHERGEGNPDLAHPLQTADDTRPETAAWQLALTNTSQANGSEAPSSDENLHWQADDAVNDALISARARQIGGVLVEDGLFRMRHLLLRINAGQALLQECAQRASLHPNHGSALLLQRLMVPPEISGAPNPLHQYIHNLTTEAGVTSTCALRRLNVNWPEPPCEPPRTISQSGWNNQCISMLWVTCFLCAASITQEHSV